MFNITLKQKIILFGGSAALSYPFFNLAVHPVYTNKHKNTNRTFVVTGATGNLGSAIVYEIARRNMRVVMACRDLEKCRSLRRQIVLETGNHKLLCRHLDLEDLESIDRFVEDISKSEPHIDVLINNAAVKDISQRELTKYGIEKNYFVNYLAPFLLTSKLLPKLKESASITKNSRIVNVIGCPKKSWELDLNDINFDNRPYGSKKAYNQSKLALAYFTILLDKLNREQKNCVYVYGTSPCRKYIVKMFDHNDTFFEYLRDVIQTYYSHQPTRVVQPTIKCSLDPALTEPGRSGKLYAFFNARWFWGKVAKDEINSKRVWNKTVEEVANLKAFNPKLNNKDEPN